MPGRKRKSEDQRRRDNTARRKLARNDEDVRAAERERDALSRSLARENEDIRAPERERDALSRSLARENEDVRAPERERDALNRSVSRENEDIRVAEQQENTARRRVARENEDIRAPERERDALNRSLVRENEDIRAPERERDALNRSLARENEDIRAPERERDALNRSVSRENEDVRVAEQQENTARRRVARENPAVRENENARRNERFRTRPFEMLLNLYEEEIHEGPTLICPCCGRLLYKNQTAEIKISNLFQEQDEEFLKAVLWEKAPFPRVTHVLRFCHTCKNSIGKKKVPRMAMSNGVGFPEMPEELKGLTPLEERLLALRLPFMQIRPLGFSRQLQLRGNVVNVENDLSVTAKLIPRQFDDAKIIQVELMRRMADRSAYMNEPVKVSRLNTAGEYLVQQPLYRENNVQFSRHLCHIDIDAIIDFVVNPTGQQAPADEEVGPDELENEEDEVIGADETLIHNVVDYEQHDFFRIAPGEGKTPISMFKDKFVDEMAFPRAYNGHKRKEIKGASYTDIVKWEIMNFDRRACLATMILFFFKRSHIMKVAQCVWTFIRKQKANQTAYKAVQVRDPEFLKSIIDNDEGYSVFKNLRSSPSYWAARCKKVIAMVRQLGKCSLFITLSAAESKWNELLVILSRLLDNIELTEEEAENLSDEHKNSLIKRDPVTCMRHFDRRYNSLHKNLLKRSNGIFSPHELDDFFRRIEFQMRGSPHCHGLYWLKDTPEYIEGNSESERKCIEFIDKYITCARSTDAELSKYVAYQVHKHSHTCKKGMKETGGCRFNFPKPPLPETMILQPLPANLSAKKKKKLKDNYETIRLNLNQKGRNPAENISFDELLDELQMDKDTYIAAIRSSIKRTTVFHKREVDEAFINPYNAELLLAWKANVDVQFVLDTYACAKYCVGYILKSDGGMSKLMRQINKKRATGSEEIFTKLENMAKALWNGTEISAQEAAGFLLGLKNVDSSRSDVYIDTSPPDERTRILKPKKLLEELPDDTEDIYQAGLIDHYIKRPVELENLCLAEFAADYEFSKTKKRRAVSAAQADGEEDEDTSEDDAEVEAINDTRRTDLLELTDGSGFVRKRKWKSKIIRYRHYAQSTDPINYFREQLMLYVPWKDEEREVNVDDPITLAKQHEDLIIQKSKLFHHNFQYDDTVLRDIVDNLENDEDSEDDDNEDDAANAEEDDRVANEMLREMPRQRPPKPKYPQRVRSSIEQFRPPNLLSNGENQEKMRSLNRKQRKFVMNVCHLIKIGKVPFHIFLSGGAGVGKSHVITAIVQTLLRFYGSIPGRDQSKSPVLVAAYTGKAAFNVFGMTLHTTFSLNPSQNKQLSEMDEGKLGTFRARLLDVKLLIIDEISMVSNMILDHVNRRLKQIFNTNADFGGISILVVGHLRQLAPIGGSYPFVPSPGMLTRVHLLWQNFKIYELDEIMRVRGDDMFCLALNNMSEGRMTPEDIALMKSREIEANSLTPEEDSIWLFQTNNECKKRNDEFFKTLQGRGFMSTAVDYIEGNLSKTKKQEILESARNLAQKDNDGLRYEVFLKVGAQYFISTNIDVPDGLFNGATGCCKDIEVVSRPSTSTNPVTADEVDRVWLRFDHPQIGAEKRKTYLSENRCQLPSEEHKTWTPIEKIPKTLSKYYGAGVKVTRVQMPLVACNGMTIAKSQGSSLQHVVVSLRGKKKLKTKELYVGSSRATSLNGLYFDGEFYAPEPYGEDDIVGKEMLRLRENPLELEVRFFEDVDLSTRKVFIHNITSLHAHLQDMSADQVGAMHADIIAIVEPKILNQDMIEIPGFHVVHRENSSSRWSSDGVVLYCRDGSDPPGYVECETVIENGKHLVLMNFLTGEVIITVIYKKPDFPFGRFCELLEEKLDASHGKAIFTGDINVNLLRRPGDITLDPMRRQDVRIFKMFEDRGFVSQLPSDVPSTDGGTQIDVCFSNFNTDSWLYESYYSYHKAICITFPKCQY